MDGWMDGLQAYRRTYTFYICRPVMERVYNVEIS
jgi:hypothetical protein